MNNIRKYAADDVRVYVMKVDETVDYMLAHLPNKDKYLERIAGFKAQSRKLEWIGVRYLLYVVRGVDEDIVYNNVGAPAFAESNTNLSISHSGGWVAVALSDSSKVGMDLEQQSPRAYRIHSHFMSDEEPFFDNQENCALAVWSAKESIYKLLGKEGVDFKKQFIVQNYAPSEHSDFEGCINMNQLVTDEFAKQQRIYYRFEPEYVLTLV